MILFARMVASKGHSDSGFACHICMSRSMGWNVFKYSFCAGSPFSVAYCNLNCASITSLPLRICCPSAIAPTSVSIAVPLPESLPNGRP